MMATRFALARALGSALLLVLTLGGCQFEYGPGAGGPLKIGLLMDYAGAPDVSADRQRGFDLAIRHVNAAGGVLGQPVEFLTAPAPRDTQIGIESARTLIDNGVHAIVGPSSSAASLPIAEQVTGPTGIPQISPSATPPELTDAVDGDFFFRTTLSDVAQGPVLARVAEERGFENLGLIYTNDPYGRGLAGSFESAWSGQIIATAVKPGQGSYLPAIRATANGGAVALLVVVSGMPEAQVIVMEALDEELFDQFIFGDAAKRPNLAGAIGGDNLGGMHGTAGASGPTSAASAA